MLIKKQILIIIGIILLLPIVIGVSKSTVTTIPSYQANTNVELNIPCVFNGTFCPSGTLCNITIIDPQGFTLINNQPAIQNDSVFLFNLNENQTVKNGEYEMETSCCAGIFCNSKSLTYMITPSGASPISTGQSSVLLSIMAVIFFVSILFFVTGFRATSMGWKVFGFAMGSVFILVLILYGLLVLNEAIATSPALISGFETFYTVAKMLGTIGILGLIVVTFLVMAKAWKIRRGLIDK